MIIPLNVSNDSPLAFNDYQYTYTHARYIWTIIKFIMSALHVILILRIHLIFLYHTISDTQHEFLLHIVKYTFMQLFLNRNRFANCRSRILANILLFWVCISGESKLNHTNTLMLLTTLNIHALQIIIPSCLIGALLDFCSCSYLATLLFSL